MYHADKFKHMQTICLRILSVKVLFKIVKSRKQ